MRRLGVVLLSLFLAGCTTGDDNPPTTTPGPTSAVTSSLVPAKTVEAVVDTKHTGCTEAITDGCWLPLYARLSTKLGSAMNLGRQAATQCTEADTRGCRPQPGETVAVVCMAIGGEGEIWFGVPMANKQVLTPDPDARRTSNDETIGFARATMFRLKDAFPQPCPV